jgi:hypothetical protein
MSLELDQKPAEDESSSRSSALLKSVGIGFGLAIVVVLLWFFYGHQKAEAVGQVVAMTTYPMHYSQNDDAIANGVPVPSSTQDRLLILAHLRITNLMNEPMVIEEIDGNLTLATNEEEKNLAVPKDDFPKIFDAFPALAPARTEPLLVDQRIPPGQTVDGLVMVSYPITQDQFDARRNMNIAILFYHHRTLVLNIAK